MQAIAGELHRLEGFGQQFREMVQRARAEHAGDGAQRWQKLLDEQAALEKEEKNLADSLAQLGPQAFLLQKNQELQQRRHPSRSARRQPQVQRLLAGRHLPAR